MSNVREMKKYESHTSINLIEEPEVFYLLNDRFHRIVGALGGVEQVGQVVNSDIDLISLSRKGLPKSVVLFLCEVLNISMDKMSQLLHISHRTLQRKEDTDLLSASATEQLLQIAEVVSEGVDVFDTIESFRNWLHSTPYILNGQKPLDFLDTSFGIQYIRNILGRIAHGIPS